MEKVSELRASLPVENSRTIGIVHLKDTMEKQGEIKIRIGIEKHSLGLFIHPEGTGTCDGPYAPILLEQHEGTLMLIVWADINQQEPTHIIDLSTAMETNRSGHRLIDCNEITFQEKYNEYNLQTKVQFGANRCNSRCIGGTGSEWTVPAILP